MGNLDRFEKLEMLGDLNEKYIKEADAYLSQPLIADIGADGGAVRLAPERRKFSWQLFAAIAACAAVLIGGTFALKSYLNRLPVVPPVDASSDSSDDSDNSNNDNLINEPDPYLEEIRERYNVSDDVKISHLWDGWEWKKFEVSGAEDGFGEYDIGRRLLDDTAFIDDNTMLTVRTLDDGSEEIAAYDLTAKTFKTLLGKADEAPKNNEVIRYRLDYANKDFLVFRVEFFAGYIANKKELRVLNLNYSETGDIPWRYKTIIDDLGTKSIYQTLIEDNILYLNIEPGDQMVPDKCYICRYDILKEDDPEVIIEDVYYLFSLPDGIIYGKSELDNGLVQTKYYELETDKPVGSYLQVWNYVKNAGFIDIPATKLSKPDEPYTVKNLITNEEYLTMPRIYEDLRWPYIRTASDSCVIPDNYGDDHLILDCVAKELFVYTDSGLEIDDEGWDWRGYREGFCVIRGDDNGCEGYILTRKTPTHTDNKPEPDPEAAKKQEYLDKFREELKVSDDVGIAYARDRLNVTEYSLPWDDGGADIAADNGRLFIDSKRAIVSHIHVQNNIEMYLLDTDEYVTLISAENDPMADENTLYDVCYATKDYVVFKRSDYKTYSDLCVIELNKDGYPFTTISQRNYSSDINIMHSGVLVNENTVYYSVLDNNRIYSLYRYEIGKDAEPELYVENGVPLCVYKGDLLYYTMSEDAPEFLQEIVLEYQIIHSVSGTLPIEGKTCAEVYFCKYGLFTVEDGKLIDCINDKVIMYDPPRNLTPYRSLDFGVAFGWFYPVCIYDARTNEVLVFEKNDSILNQTPWASCYWGLCGYGSNGYLICE